MKFDIQAVQKIAEVLQTEVKERSNAYRMVLDHTESGRRLSLEIFPEMNIGKDKGTLISVYTSSSHLQLHYCTGYVVSESLGEVIFIAENHGRVSGLIIEREAGCSLFANVNAAVLSGDFATLAPEVMLSGIALSVTESLLPNARKRARRKKSATKKPAPRKRSR